MSGSNEMFVKIAVELALSVGVILLVLCFGLVLRSLLFRRLTKWAQQTKHDLDDIIISAINGPFVIWFLMLGIYIALHFHELPENVVNTAGKILLALGLFSATLVAANISSGVITHYSSKLGPTLPGATLTRTISRIIIFTVGILVILNALGISITPIIATLGVGGLAVALALQDTLSNLFAGFHIITNRIVRVGDYIKLDSGGEEGYVIDVNWRTTKVKMLDNNTILIPNSKLTQTNVTNYYLPDKNLIIFVNVGVHYNSDLKHVEQVTCEVAKEVMREVQGGVPEFDPFIRYNTFGDSSIGFTVTLMGKEYFDQYLIRHEFIKRLHQRYSKEGIVIPYPTRTINITQEAGK
ncbi:MAG: mechanosensitive ion channel family protein [Sedimentisphaerales bacterium]|jgi:small-conductance mechanosensitive channel